MITVNIFHYPPIGKIAVEVCGELVDKKLQVKIKGPPQERERAIKKIVRQVKKFGGGIEVQCWITHKLDQMAAEQREWDGESNDS